jgi:gas vesicle protein
MSRDDDEELEEVDEEAEDDDDEAEKSGPGGRQLGGFAVGVALGALLGAAAALLLAPASGHVTRRRLRRKLDHAREIAGEQWENLSRRAKREIRRRAEAAEKSVNGER